MEKSKRQRIVLYLVLIGGLALLVCYFDEILAFFGQVGGVSLPLVLGCGIAYVLNIIMSAMERHYFTKKDAPWVAKTRRPVCLAASIFVVLGIIFLLIRVVAPELLNAVLLLGEGIPVYVEKGIEWAVDHSGGIPALKDWLESLAIDWPKIIHQFLGSLTEILNSTVELVGLLSSSIVRLFMSLIFGIYLLSGKERLLDQAKRILKVFLQEKNYERLFHVVAVAHHTFTSYIAGQCTEAVILGSLCTVGMLIPVPLRSHGRSAGGSHSPASDHWRLHWCFCGSLHDPDRESRTGDPVYLFSGDPSAAGREPDLPQSGGRFRGTSWHVDPGGSHGRRRSLGNSRDAHRRTSDGDRL